MSNAISKEVQEARNKVEKAYRQGKNIKWRNKGENYWCKANVHKRSEMGYSPHMLAFHWDVVEYYINEPQQFIQDKEEVILKERKIVEAAYHAGKDIKWRRKDRDWEWSYSSKKQGDTLGFHWEDYEYYIAEEVLSTVEEEEQADIFADLKIEDYRIHPDDEDEKYLPGGKRRILPKYALNLEDKIDGSKFWHSMDSDNALKTTQPKEEIKMKSIKIEEQVNIVMGAHISNAADYSDESIFTLIAEMEKEIEKLGEIKNKPKKLESELERMTDEIAALVKYVDGRDPK